MRWRLHAYECIDTWALSLRALFIDEDCYSQFLAWKDGVGLYQTSLYVLTYLPVLSKYNDHSRQCLLLISRIENYTKDEGYVSVSMRFFFSQSID